MARRTVGLTLASCVWLFVSPLRAADRPHDSIRLESPTNWTFHGVVVDEAGAVVPRASVGFHASFFTSSVATASDGSFSLSGKAVGFFVLIAKNAAGDRQAFRLRERTDVNGTPLPPLHFVLKKSRTLDMAVVDGKGKAVSDASVGAITRDFHFATGKTDAAGKALLQVPDGLSLGEVFAIKDEVGLDAVSYRRQRLGGRTNPRTLAADDAGPLKFELTDARPVRVHVVDQNRKPVAGIRVSLRSLWLPKRGVAFTIPEDDSFQPKTDAAGIAVFRYLPAAQRRFLRLDAQHRPSLGRDASPRLGAFEFHRSDDRRLSARAHAGHCGHGGGQAGSRRDDRAVGIQLRVGTDSRLAGG